MDHALLTLDEAAAYLGFSKETLSDWRYKDRGRILTGQQPLGPRWVDGRSGIRPRARGYRKEALDTWLAQQEAGAA